MMVVLPMPMQSISGDNDGTYVNPRMRTTYNFIMRTGIPYAQKVHFWSV
jgi:hypothetical protein